VDFDADIPTYERNIDNSVRKTGLALSLSPDHGKKGGFDMFILLDKEGRRGYISETLNKV
jgi:hypothetical protein